MKVKLIVPLAGVKPWNVGDEFECDAEEAKRLVQAGIAEAVAEQRVERAVKPVPAKRSK